MFIVVLQRGLQILDGKLERFVTKKWEKRLCMRISGVGSFAIARFEVKNNLDRSFLKFFLF